MKTLNTIQTLAKIGKIFSKIIFILSLVGAIGCTVGIVTLAILPDGLKIGGVTLHSIIEKSDGITVGTCFAAMAVGIVFCIGEAVLAKISERYFKNELASGTPFTFAGAKELTRFGICAICIPIVTRIVAEITYHIMNFAFDGVTEFDLDDPSSIGFGIALIIGGLLCKYGAELTTSGKDDTDPIPRS